MSERREAHRRRVYLGGRIVHRCIRSDTACLLRDLSPGGARLTLNNAVPLPDSFDLVVECHGTTRPVELIWRQGNETGVRFMAANEDAAGLLQPRTQPGVSFKVPLGGRLH